MDARKKVWSGQCFRCGEVIRKPADEKAIDGTKKIVLCDCTVGKPNSSPLVFLYLRELG